MNNNLQKKENQTVQNNSILILALIGIVSMISACTIVNTFQPPDAPKTQLQTRQVQTREFDTNNVKLIMKAVINVLQDDGFIVKNAQLDLGLLTAQKEIDLSQSRGNSNDFWSEFFKGIDRNRSRNNTDLTYSKIKIVESSVNISEFGKQTKVRANFQVKVLDNLGNPKEVYQVEDAKFYQDFFVKVDKGVFIQKQGF
ncbi:MAG: hypothetical protein ACOYND_08500 [Bacteroidota bacterium]|jgi:hypothetical protein